MSLESFFDKLPDLVGDSKHEDELGDIYLTMNDTNDFDIFNTPNGVSGSSSSMYFGVEHINDYSINYNSPFDSLHSVEKNREVCSTFSLEEGILVNSIPKDIKLEINNDYYTDNNRYENITKNNIQKESDQITKEDEVKSFSTQITSYTNIKIDKETDEDNEILDLKGIRLLSKMLRRTIECAKCHKMCYLEESLRYNGGPICFECIRPNELKKWDKFRDREWKTTESTKKRTCKHCNAQRSFYRFILDAANMKYQYCYYCKIKKAWNYSKIHPKSKRKSMFVDYFGKL